MTAKYVMGWLVGIGVFAAVLVAPGNAQENGLSKKDWKEGGWKKAGFNYEGASCWFDAGSTTPEEAQVWYDTGLSCFEVKKWKRAGISTPKAALEWYRFGISPENAKRFTDAGLSAGDARTWTMTFGNSDTALDWRATGLSLDAAEVWANKGYTPQNAREWSAAGFPIEDVGKWTASGFNAASAVEWKKLGFSWAEAESCKRRGYDSKDIGSSMGASVPKEEVVALCENVDEADLDGWEKNFSIAEISVWSKSFKTDSALAWKKAKFTYKEAAEYEEYGILAATKIKLSCPKGIKSEYELLSANPYDTKGVCYKYGGQNFQLLSRTAGLYMNSQVPVYLDCGQDSAPRVFVGVVKGAGVFEYTTNLGAIKKIASLKKIHQTVF